MGSSDISVSYDTNSNHRYSSFIIKSPYIGLLREARLRSNIHFVRASAIHAERSLGFA